MLLGRAIPGVRLVNFGHLGDGNLHYNVQTPVNSDAAAFLRTRPGRTSQYLVYDSAQQFGGSISAEHSVSSLKLVKLEKHKLPSDYLGMMRVIRRALDPQNLMNPGRVLRV